MDAADIIAQWKSNNLSIDWRPMTPEGKRQWLKACLFWSGLPNRTIPSFHYVIDGNQVTSDLDLYCLLGEVFFGYRGYFGQGIDGFDDCFSEISIYNPDGVVKDGATVVVKNALELKSVLDEDYFQIIVDIFRKHGFHVILD